MDFEEAEQRFVRLKNQLSRGGITPQEFEEGVKQLTFKDTQGKLWKMSSKKNGAWLVWTGSGWSDEFPYDNYPEYPSAQPPPDFQMALNRYHYLTMKKGHSWKSFSDEEFTKKVNQLRLQDSKGVWWQIRETDGGWLRWDGSAWIEDNPQGIDGTLQPIWQLDP